MQIISIMTIIFQDYSPKNAFMVPYLRTAIFAPNFLIEKFEGVDFKSCNAFCKFQPKFNLFPNFKILILTQNVAITRLQDR